jgi:iron-sulfur cluster protein
VKETATNLKAYRKQIVEALENAFQRSALKSFNVSYRENRPEIYKGMDFQKISADIAAAKGAAVADLKALFEQFKEKAEKAGSKVHLAASAREANDIIADIARENGVARVVKSKSMTSEEIFLNTHLEKAGIVVTETDLGEWIIQLRKEGPSHMVLPAIHLSRYQVGELFSKVSGKRQDPEDIDRLVKVARKELRPSFLKADMGISGANFAIAESGVLGLVTNEGNMRLATTLPKIHVAVVGVEKLLPDLASALRILKVLPRNATGQAITSYVTWIKGNNECAVAPDHKKIMHIVFLDNGRLALGSDPVFSEALKCIRCGACANVCPIYSMIGGHRYGHIYIGAIGLILTVFFHGHERIRAIVKNCLNCQACKDVCPVRIDLPYLIKKSYRAVLAADGSRPIKNRLLAGVMKNRKLFHFILRQAYLAQKPLVGNQGMIRHLPAFFNPVHGFRSLPPIVRTPLRDQWHDIMPTTGRPKYRLALFAGCTIDFIYPEQGRVLADLLSAYPVAVEFPKGQTCCGLPLSMAAEEETARRVAKQNLRVFQSGGYDYILTLCASCASHLRHHYPRLLKNEHRLHPTLERFTERVIDFSSFMVNVLKMSKDEFKGSRRKTAYHAPCHLCRGLGVIDEPKKMIELAGLEYVPTKDEDVCCGFGGTYSVDFPEISAQILKNKLDCIQAGGAVQLVTDCPGCVIQIRGGMDQRNNPIPVLHIAEAVAAARRAKKVS